MWKVRRAYKRGLGIAFLSLIILIMMMGNKISYGPVVAGSWYPKDKVELEKTIKSYLGKSEDKNEKIKGLIVPHAGYPYSGKVAGEGYKQLKEYKTIIIIAPSHYAGFNGAIVLDADYYKTPLGKIKISKKTKELMNETGIRALNEGFKQEHSLEIQLPFLQTQLKKFELIPILIGEANPKNLSKILIKYIDEDTLIIASSDLSHFHSYEEATKLDNNCVKAISELSYEKTLDCEACGVFPILTLIEIAKELNWAPEVIKYLNSGDVTGDKTSVVGYASIAFIDKSELNKKEKQILLKLAREKLESLYNKKELKIPKLTSNLKEIKGCFVTLTENEELRGCIGNIIGIEELYKGVLSNTENAALSDPRFKPISELELKNIKIEISVLSEPKKLEYKNEEELLEKLRAGIDGVVLRKGRYESTFLPQVWEQLLDKEEFLEHLSLKAGLDKEDWKKAEIYIYQVEKFSEN